MHQTRIWATDIGSIKVSENGQAITGVWLVDEQADNGGSGDVSALQQAAIAQIREYLAGTRQQFDLPLEPAGTDFQQQVWRSLLAIPYGETRSYRDVAETIGKPLACRAVGMANHRNPILLVIPCHRVVGSNGDLTGYGPGIELKRQLLELEAGRVRR